MKKGLRLRNAAIDEDIIKNLSKAETSWEKTVGLLGKNSLGIDEGLFIPECRVIHTFFMRFVFDVVFVDKNLNICKLLAGIKPWRITFCVNASGVIELAEGVISTKGLKVGDRLEILT